MNDFTGKLYLVGDGGIPHAIGEITEIKEEVEVESPSEKMMELQKEFIGSLSVQIDNEAPFVKEIQNQTKKYKRDKAQYKFWKDQEFVGNNRAGRRRK